MKISVNSLPSHGRFYGGGESMQYRSFHVVKLGGWNRIKERIHKIRSIYVLYDTPTTDRDRTVSRNIRPDRPRIIKRIFNL